MQYNYSNNTISGNNSSYRVNHLFELQAAKTPELIAVQFGNFKLTYQELNDQSNSLAAYLQQNCTNNIIAISSIKSVDAIVAIIAILKSGKTYLPLDLNFPVDRLNAIITNAGVDDCICDIPSSTFFKSLGLNTILISAISVKLLDVEKANQSKAAVYVLHTSGSTGIPKGVCLNHASLINLLYWQNDNSIAAEGNTTLQLSPITFDVSFQEIFATITSGGKLIIANDDIRLDPEKLIRFIESESINRIYLPYVALQYLAEAADTFNLYPICLNEVITAGEALRITPQIKALFAKIPSTTLHNQYGPTETHVVTALKLSSNTLEWPMLPSIGTPIWGTEIWIVDELMNLVKDGDEGELLISGVSLADEYINAPERTAERFVFWNHPTKGKIRVYKTGDIAAYLPDGNINFLGRKDDQVKIRGYRIELGEIELALLAINGISQAVVVAQENDQQQKNLIAYIQGNQQELDIHKVRTILTKQLPEYMLPSTIIWLNEMPKTSSGKINKSALPKPSNERPLLGNIFIAPVTATQQKLASIWCRVLSLNTIGINDHFFELGGNSLLAMKTTMAIRNEFSFPLTISLFYQNPTILLLVDLISGKEQFLPRNSTRKNNDNFNNSKDIAIIGLNGRFPGANSVDELWQLLLEGKETTSFFDENEIDLSIDEAIRKNSLYVKARGIIDSPELFDAAFFGITPALASLMDPQQRIFLEIAWELLESTGHLPSCYNERVGVFAGSGNNSYYLKNVLSNKDKVESAGELLVMTHNEKDYIATRTAYALNLTGPAVSVYSACSTSLLAVAQAVESIRSGKCEAAIAGGISITVPLKSGHLYQDGAMLSKDGHCRSFDANATGTVFSDGAGVVLLKSVDKAIEDGDTIFGIIKGVGINNDGNAKGSFTAPSAIGQAGAINSAIEDAAINPNDINYIEAHGTATPIGDPIEMDGLKLAFGKNTLLQYCAIGSIKSNFGHLTAAAGVAGLIKTSLMVKHKVFVPTILFDQPNPSIDFENSPFYVNTKVQQLERNKKVIAGVSSFGVGGTNVHVILSSYEQKLVDSSIQNEPVLICWSAKSQTSAENYAIKLSSFLQKNANINLADLAYTLQLKRTHFSVRNFIIAKNYDDLIHQLKDTINGITIPENSNDPLNHIANNWLVGKSVDFSIFHQSKKRNILVNAPTYAFDKKPYWIEPNLINELLTVTENKQITNDDNGIKKQIRKIIIDISGEDEEVVTDESNFIEMGLDSLVLTQLAIQLSKAFSVAISFRQLNEQFDHINILSVYIKNNLPVEVKQQNKTELVATNILTEAEKELISKPFGAIARINKNADGLSSTQNEFILSFIKKYNNKTKSSKAYTQENRMVMADPRVVSGFKPLIKEMIYPIVVNKSNGSTIWDIDGNEYIDALNGFGSNFLGYQFPSIQTALKKQIDDGYEIGPQHELAGEVCSLIASLTGCERVALCNTGSEAVLGAMRIARTVTGRSLIVAFNGSYHGINDEVIVRGNKQKPYPAAPGIMPEAVSNMLMLEYGTPETLAIIKERAHELAAVLIEPVQSRRPEFFPVSFLKELQTITESEGVVYILDEVITGFRSHPGGIQGIIGMQADLVTYGKVVGGGMPIGVIAGKQKFMNALDGGNWQFGDNSIPEAGVTYFAGTFVRHPFALAAAKASLLHIKQVGVALQDKINGLTTQLVEGLNAVNAKYNTPYIAVSFASIWKIKMKEELPYSELIFALMREKGIHIWDNFPCFLTASHTEKEILKIIAAFESSVVELKSNGFICNAINFNLPPVPGAKLGRDPEGNPAWYIPDPSLPKNYIKLQ